MKKITRILLAVVAVATIMAGCATTMVDMSHQDRGFMRNSGNPEVTFLIEDKVLEGKGPWGFGALEFKVNAYAETARALAEVYANIPIAVYPADSTPANLAGRVFHIVPQEYNCPKPSFSTHYVCTYKALVDKIDVEGISQRSGWFHDFDENDLRAMTPRAFADWAIKAKALLDGKTASQK